MSGTSGQYAFNPGLADILLDAYERCGKIGVELTEQNQDMSSGRRSMNFVLSSWANRGVNLFTVQLTAKAMTQGVAQIVDDASCIDVLADSVSIRTYINNGQYETNDQGNLILTDQGSPILIVGPNAPTSPQPDPIDLLLYPLSRGDYQAIPNKTQQGRPTSYWLDRQVVPVFNLWLVPGAVNGVYQLRYYRSRQVQDADISGGQQLAVPYRFLEAFVADLAAHLAMKWMPARAQLLTSYAQEQWVLASEEDRERVSSFLVPDFSGYYD
jgi:hypothetical protein